ncbi:acyl-CoA synthetase [Desulfoplanes formicivorans]|uniref:Acyl-CoA synthetase n=1 Tax=Desulfoplanes formicivorans TaxID=1592317 RepID=A0A194AKE1_9BACT|nr:acetate--CoA ligase [Desulfoplanes formicivorans]GAU09783.1 acyl-CoA synthetase [Desulfoplanes formicivorans]
MIESKYDLHALFNPKTVAVIGASSVPGKVGHTILHNMIQAEYQGTLIPVNPKSDTILGLPVTKSINDLPVGLDLAVLTIPKQFVVQALEQLAEIKTRSAIIITAGFKEVGHEGYKLEQQVAEICTKHHIALIGPNCLGMINIGGKVNASFASGKPLPGSIAFFSQSGALCSSILDWALGENVGFSKFISLGNKAVLSESHMLEYLGNDPETKVVLGYIENITAGEEFIRTARKVTARKPVIMVKSGTTSAGAKAASSHTGAIAGSDNAYSAAFNQAGVIRARSISTLFNLAQAFSLQPLPKGPNLAIVTNAGGPGIMAADACERSALNMASLSPTTVSKLKEVLPPYASLYNPIDIAGDANAQAFGSSLDIVLRDENIHAVLVMLTPTSTAADDLENITQAIIDVAKTTDKPVFPCFMGKKRISDGQKMLQEAGLPCYIFPEPAIESLEAMYKYHEWQNKAEPVIPEIQRDRDRAAAVISGTIARGADEIVEFQAQEILQAYNLPVPRTGLARTSDDAVTFAEDIGYPVVLKIASPQISHKSDVGGVKVGLKDADAVRDAFMDITSRAQRMRPEAMITGCLVQEMAPKGAKEIIIGFKRDDQFGPLIMFGLGGIYVEVLKDIAFRLAPLSREDAHNIIREIRSYMLLKGVRGERSVDFAAIENILLIMSRLSLDFPEIYEAEFNPVLVNKDKAVVADVRISLHT